MWQVCINCILKGEQPKCHSCMVRGRVVGWDVLPECCKGCDFISAEGKCAAFGSVDGIKNDSCGLRASPRGIKDYSKLREELSDAAPEGGVSNAEYSEKGD